MTTKAQKSKKKYDEKQRKAMEIKWDKKFITKCLIVAIAAIVAAIVLNLDFSKQDTTWQYTTATITSVKPIENLYQGRTGNRLAIDAYEVGYSYKVGNMTYSGSSFLSLSKKQNKVFIGEIKIGAQCRIFYNLDNTESYIDPDISYVRR